MPTIQKILGTDCVDASNLKKWQSKLSQCSQFKKLEINQSYQNLQTQTIAMSLI